MEESALSHLQKVLHKSKYIRQGVVDVSMRLCKVEIWLELILTRLLIVKQHWRNLNAFPAGDLLVPLMIKALEATLSVNNSSNMNRLLAFDNILKATVSAM